MSDDKSTFLMYHVIHDFLCLLPFFPCVLQFLPAPHCITTKSAYNANSACFVQGFKNVCYRCVKTRQEAEFFFFYNSSALTNLKLFLGLRYQENNTQRNKIYVWPICGQTFHSNHCAVIYLFIVINCSQSLNIF